MDIITKYRFARTPWGTTPPASRTGIILHHTVTPEGGSAAGAEAQVRNVNRMHPNGSYNYLVDYLGRVWEIAGLHNVGAHAYQANTPNWGICYLGDGRYNFTDAAEKAIRELIQWLQGHAGKTLTIRGHGQVNRTACPGGIIQARINAGAFGTPHSGGSTPTGGGADGAFPARNLYGHNWTVSAQNKLIRLGYNLGPWGADGKDGKVTQTAVRALQKRGGIHVDGIYGPQTDAVANRLLTPSKPAGRVTTASFGRVDVVQRALKTQYPLYASRLVVDNIDGPATQAAVKEFQRRAGLVVDGIAGPATRKALGV